MNTYLVLKWIHILSSVALVGVGFGSAYYMFFVNRTKNVAAIAEVSRLVVRADYWFTTPAVIIQPLSGFAMLSMSGYSWTETWLVGAYVLFVVMGACWLPVVWLQIRMAKIAKTALQEKAELPQQYWRYARIWTLLGLIAFPLAIVIFGLMVLKPSV